MLQENIVSIIRDAKNALDQRGGLKAVYFVGCGGSWAASQDRKSTRLNSSHNA